MAKSRTTGPRDNRLFKKVTEKSENPPAVGLGKLGGPKDRGPRAKALPRKKRSKTAHKGAATRWSDYFGWLANGKLTR